jgi:hypothetical protein
VFKNRRDKHRLSRDIFGRATLPKELIALTKLPVLQDPEATLHRYACRAAGLPCCSTPC